MAVVKPFHTQYKHYVLLTTEKKIKKERTKESRPPWNKEDIQLKQESRRTGHSLTLNHPILKGPRFHLAITK